MISLSNTTAQTLTPGQSITFNTVVLHTGCAECHRANTSSVKLRAKGIYDVHFSANIGATVAGAAQLLLRVLLLVGGHAEPEDLQQKHRAQKQRRERHGKKRRVQPLPEGMEMKPLHAPASVPR